MGLMNGMLTLKDGTQIYYQVTGNKADNKPYILLIPGGPGFSHIAMKDLVASLEQQNKAAESPYHFILFDPLHCGRSDKAKDFEAEFTVENYAEIAAQVVEAVQEKLNLEKMDLRIIGRSFGSMTAMSMPACRPQWILKADSQIVLNQLISIAGPINHHSIEQSIAYVREHYKDRPDYNEIVESVEKLMTGSIQNSLDYQQSIVRNLAPLYADKYETLKEETEGKMLKDHPDLTRHFLSFMSLFSSKHAEMYDSLTGCSIELLNYFFKHRFNQFDLQEKIAKYKEVYEKLMIICISGSRDYAANPANNASLLHKQLPQSLTEVNFDSKHSINADHPTDYPDLINKALQGRLTAKNLDQYNKSNKKVIDSYNLAIFFDQQAATIKALYPTSPPPAESFLNFFLPCALTGKTGALSHKQPVSDDNPVLN
ncbi:alpha/beta hydrolase [Legionella dresdenensis]|uniref:Alpha/beta hydrolase n=1 Tax=Legionella dresdenensis TaxID=450200 RepID=A0ABV8CHY5_9GAMM